MEYQSLCKEKCSVVGVAANEAITVWWRVFSVPAWSDDLGMISPAPWLCSLGQATSPLGTSVSSSAKWEEEWKCFAGLLLGLNDMDICFYISTKPLYKWKKRLIDKIEWENNVRWIVNSLQSNQANFGGTLTSVPILFMSQVGSLLPSGERLENKERPIHEAQLELLPEGP